MDSETIDAPEDPEAPLGDWSSQKVELNPAFVSLMEFHDKLERRFQREILRACPDMPGQALEALTAMRMFAELRANPEEFEAAMRRGNSRCKKR